MIDERTSALASRYVLGNVSAEERREFETALQADERLRLLVKELRGTQGEPTVTRKTIQPLPETAMASGRGRDDSAASAVRSSRTSDWLVWSPWLVSTCFAALCLLLISSIHAQREKLAERVGRWERQNLEIVRLQRQNAQLQKAAAEQAANYKQGLRDFESNLMKGVEQLSTRTAAVTNHLDQQLATTTRELAAARKDVAELSNAKMVLEHAVATLGTRERDRFQNARLVALRPAARSDAPAEGVGAVLWSPADQRGILFAEKLRPLPATEAYQLWLIEANGKPAISAGLIPAASGSIHIGFSARARIDSLTRVLVTIESAVGAASPSRSVVLAGE